MSYDTDRMSFLFFHQMRRFLSARVRMRRASWPFLKALRGRARFRMTECEFFLQETSDLLRKKIFLPRSITSRQIFSRLDTTVQKILPEKILLPRCVLLLLASELAITNTDTHRRVFLKRLNLLERVCIRHSMMGL